MGIEFCRKYISKLHFDIPALELKDTPNTICYGSLCAIKPYPYLSLIKTIRIPHQIHIVAKTSRVYKYQPEDEQTNFASGTTFIPHQKVANSGLDFVNVLCTQSEQYLPILMENNKNHQITLDKGILGYSSLDILDFERPKYQRKDCVKMVDCILSENDQYNECFLLHSTLPHEPDFRDGIRIINGNDDTIFENQTAVAHCISADAKMSKGFAETISNHISGLQEYCYKSKAFVGSVIPFWDNDANRFIYNLVTKNKFFEKPTLENLRISLENMRGHALLNNVQIITMPKIGCGLDKLFWNEVLKILKDTFTDSGILIQIISRNELDCKIATKSTNSEDYIENEIDSYANEWTNKKNELETDFTKDSKSCQPPCKEQFPILRPKELNNDLIDYYLQYQPQELKDFIKQFDFQYTDLEDEELVMLIDMIIDSRDVYSQHKFDIGQTKQKFHVTLKPNSELRKQRPSKVPLHLEDKLEKLLGQLQETGIIRETGDDDELGSLFVNPIILLPKADYVKLVIDARYLNSITDLTNYSWPLEPVQMIMTRINGKYFTASDLSCAYHQVPLSEETQKLTSFIVGGKQYTYQVGFYGLCGLPQWFSRMMAINFEPLVKKKQAITYLDDSLLQSQTKGEMFRIIHEYHQLLRKGGLKAAPDKTHFFLRKVKFLGHVISQDGIQPVAKRVQDLKNLKSPECKRDVMKVLGCLGFYSCYIKNLHVDSQPFYELIKDTTPFKWTEQHETLFNQIKERISEDTILAVPSTEYPFHIHVDSSNVGTGCILVQQFPEGKRIVSFNSRVFDKAEQKMSTLHRELCGIVSALQTYEHYIIGSPFPIYLYCDHKPILYLWGRKGQLSHRFSKYQVIITKFHNLKIIWTPGSNLAFPDILSRNVTLSDINKLQLQHKEIPKEISFYDEKGDQMHYTIKHEDSQDISCNDFFPIICQHGNDRQILHLKNDGDEQYIEDYFEDNEVLATMQDMTDCFKLGKTINQYKRLCSDVCPYFTNCTIEDETYSEIEEQQDDGYNSDNEIAELNFDQKDSDFLHDFSLANESIRRNKSQKPILKSNIDSELHPEVDTKELIQKLSDFAKTADLDVTTLVEEQLNDPVLQKVRSWIKKSDKRPTKTHDINQSKALLSYFNKFEQLFIDEETNLLCYNETVQETNRTEMKICVPLSLFLPLFKLAHTHSHSGHPGIFKTFENVRQYFFWPGRYKWIVYLIEDCIECQTNKSKRHDLHEAPLEQWGELETTPFKTIHIDHKGPLSPSSNSNNHCLVVVDAFSRFIGVYPVKDTSAQATITALEKWITS